MSASIFLELPSSGEVIKAVETNYGNNSAGVNCNERKYLPSQVQLLQLITFFCPNWPSHLQGIFTNSFSIKVGWQPTRLNFVIP